MSVLAELRSSSSWERSWFDAEVDNIDEDEDVDFDVDVEALGPGPSSSGVGERKDEAFRIRLDGRREGEPGGGVAVAVRPAAAAPAPALFVPVLLLLASAPPAFAVDGTKDCESLRNMAGGGFSFESGSKFMIPFRAVFYIIPYQFEAEL
jgi:hypothetical protein